MADEKPVQFFGLAIKAGETQPVVWPRPGALNLHNAALSGAKAGASAQLYIKLGNGPEVLLASLVADRLPQTRLHGAVLFDDAKKILFRVEGAGEVTVVGTLLLEQGGADEDPNTDEEDDVSEELREDIRTRGERRAKGFDEWAKKYAN